MSFVFVKYASCMLCFAILCSDIYYIHVSCCIQSIVPFPIHLIVTHVSQQLFNFSIQKNNNFCTGNAIACRDSKIRAARNASDQPFQSNGVFPANELSQIINTQKKNDTNKPFCFDRIERSQFHRMNFIAIEKKNVN